MTARGSCVHAPSICASVSDVSSRSCTRARPSIGAAHKTPIISSSSCLNSIASNDLPGCASMRCRSPNR
eukprot:606839-Prymnesium_polylepis.1